MNYSVYQIQMTREIADKVNAGETVPAFEARNKMNLDFAGHKIGGLADEALTAGFYTHVANIEADSANDVFEIGNMGPESAITRFSQMHSLSVGDLIVDEEGQVIVVAPVGFVAFAFRPEMNKVAA
jgi:hypothetical protein